MKPIPGKTWQNKGSLHVLSPSLREKSSIIAHKPRRSLSLGNARRITDQGPAMLCKEHAQPAYAAMEHNPKLAQLFITTSWSCSESLFESKESDWNNKQRVALKHL